MYDYEFTETRIFNRCSSRVLVPEWIDDAVLDRIGLATHKRFKYTGLKEELYVRSHASEPGFPATLANAIGSEIEKQRVLVVLRPPASTANYHDPRSDSVFAAILNALAAAESAFTIIVPRTREQAGEIRERLASIDRAEKSFAVLEKAVSGLDLINMADLVISGGGTMNREAALLGVPVYSIFQGEQGSLDRKMDQSGEITFIRSEGDIQKLILRKRAGDTGRKSLTDRVEQFVRKHIDFFLENDLRG